MKFTMHSLLAGLLLTVPFGAVAEGGEMERARTALDTMRQVVQQIEGLAKDTKDDAVKQTCIVGAHQEMNDILATVESTVNDAAGQGADAENAALETVQVAAGTIDQLRGDVLDCIGADDLVGPGGPPASARGYDPVGGGRGASSAVGAPRVRPPGPPSGVRPPAASPAK